MISPPSWLSGRPAAFTLSVNSETEPSNPDPDVGWEDDANRCTERAVWLREKPWASTLSSRG